MIRKRKRPQERIREMTREVDEEPQPENEEEKLLLADLIELQKSRKARQGIDAVKLNKGDARRKKKQEPEETVQGGLRKGARDDEEEEDEGQEARARRVVRTSNFTQQTNALDVDKHMMEYIEKNLKIRSKPRDDSDNAQKPDDPQEALYRLAERWKMDKQKSAEEGSVTNSLSMLTAIPEVDLGMDTRLRNIEDTEKAKRAVAEERQERRKPTNNDEAHLVANRFYRPNLKSKSDADILRDAKLEAMGLPAQDDLPRQSNHDRQQMSTDELVMERFKKRMRKP